jgi:hypothetical protein
MDEAGFRTSLKRMGKKPHVIEELVACVREYEAYLKGTRDVGLAEAGEKDVRAYVASLPGTEVKQRMRGVALYYRHTGNEALARLAAGIREEGIAKTRQAFKLRDFRGVNPQDVARLEALGIVTVEDMLTAGRTPQDRQQLAHRSGVSPEAVLEMVKLSDLSRLGAIKAVRARLYYDAGLDTPDKFAHWEPEALREMLVQWVERTGFDGVAPLPKELRNAVEKARTLPRIVEYD